MNPEHNPLNTGNYILLDHASKVCQPNQVYIDAGANVGGMIPSAHQLEVHAFEPVPAPYAQLVKDFGTRPNTYFNNVGLSDRITTLCNITVCNAWTLGDPEALKLSVVPAFKDTRFDVQLITLDSYLLTHPIKVGVIKLDVDGYEYRFLKGAYATIMRDRPLIYIELSYLPRVIGDSIESMVDFIINDLHYTFFSNDATFQTKDSNMVLNYYPWKSSFDVTLLPDENLNHWLP